MKVSILNSKNVEKGSVTLPAQFSEAVRHDLIHRAVVAMQANRRQPYGNFLRAGKGYSIDISKRRHDYKTVYGFGSSRTPRKIMSRSGTRMNWVGAFAPQTRGGRRAHPPKVSKIWEHKLNTKERRKAIRSAIAATMHKDIVSERGHKVPKTYPFIVDNDFESLSKTKDVLEAFEGLGLGDELSRSSQKSIRAGKGKTRARPYNKRIGPLVVVSTQGSLLKAAQNIPGVDVVAVNQLNAEVLAPGALAGRLTLWTSAAIEKLAKDKLFS